MKIYIAAPWADRTAAAEAAIHVENAGYTITHKWWEHEDVGLADPRITQQAVRDVLGVMQAHALIVLQTQVSEGKAVEQGLALAGGKPIFVVKADSPVPSNVFQSLPNFWIVQTLESALEKLALTAPKEKLIHEV